MCDVSRWHTRHSPNKRIASNYRQPDLVSRNGETVQINTIASLSRGALEPFVHGNAPAHWSTRSVGSRVDSSFEKTC